MRLVNICDEMNVTGCTEQHQWEATGTGFRHFIYVYQIECAIALAFLVIFLFVFLGIRSIRKKDASLEKNGGSE